MLNEVFGIFKGIFLLIFIDAKKNSCKIAHALKFGCEICQINVAPNQRIDEVTLVMKWCRSKSISIHINGNLIFVTFSNIFLGLYN